MRYRYLVIPLLVLSALLMAGCHSTSSASPGASAVASGVRSAASSLATSPAESNAIQAAAKTVGSCGVSAKVLATYSYTYPPLKVNATPAIHLGVIKHLEAWWRCVHKAYHGHWSATKKCYTVVPPGSGFFSREAASWIGCIAKATTP
jgi:hypothetical protein